MSWIIWARSGVIVAPLLVGMCRRSALRGCRDGATIRDAWSLPRTRVRPEEPQPSIEGQSGKEGEGVERDAGAGRGHKKTAAQRLSTTTYYQHNLSLCGADNPASRYHPRQFCLSTRRTVVPYKYRK